MNNLLKHYKVWFGVSILFVLAAVAAIWVYGLNLGIDFKGGTLTQVTFTEAQPSVQEVKDTLNQNGYPDAIVQAAEGTSVIIRTQPQELEEHKELLAVLSGAFGNTQENQFTSIGPAIGKELATKAVYQFVLISLGIILYIAYAFRKVTRPVTSWRFGWATIIALLHDIVIVVGLFAVLGKFYNVEIDTMFVTAILTVLGFSVHDTIVVFDRIRENLRLRAGQGLDEIINSSISQTVVRSINTSVTVVFVLAALLLFGGESIRYFVIALLAGVVVGTYSSIFISAPLLMVWHNRDLKRK
jgi:preprotein translocase subunit SecF